ncbi:MAG TPA: 8-amino-7-oxononanoate synthase [Pirellulales bacterium]|nr:8-amino-7-oxononanoate synthase [Pirellulales bacterium]
MSMANDPLAWIADELDLLAQRDLHRQLRAIERPQTARLQMGGREFVNFAANDYLGLAADSRLVEAAVRAAKQWGWGAGASPLVVGRTQAHAQLERRLAEFEGTDSAILFSTGFAANQGAITALVGKGDAVFSDALNHASIVDGCRLSRAEVHVYPHADLSSLQKLLATASASGRRLIVTDSLFSMDGDLAPLTDLAELARKYDCMLMVDEAHATGVFGRKGRGVAEHLGCEDGVHIRVGTLSKALGGIGGFVAGSRMLTDWLANRARTYVFSTALPPAAAAAACTALDIVAREPLRRETLLSRAANLTSRLKGQGWNVGTTRSQIIPLLIGEASQALTISATLAGQGYWAPAIRPPSVPAGEARLRISLSYAHDDSMIDGLVEALGRLKAA